MMTSIRFVFSLLIAAFAANNSAACNQDLKDPNNQVQVVDASVTTTRTDGPVFVSVIGELRNTTNNTIDELVIEAKLTDTKGKVIDVITEPVFGLVVPAGQQIAFRLQAPAATEQESYSGVTARVISGSAKISQPSRTPPQKSSKYLEIIISWAPMILLILVWLFLARKYSGKGSAQEKMLTAINEQNALFKQQIAAIEAIASSISNKRGNND